MSGAYYNEIDPRAAACLRELIKRGHIAPGEVDERSIEDVAPNDLQGFTQVHWFAGIGVWSYALRLAGWEDNRPVWTGSCPCQPLSQAGKGLGFADERHLWPAWEHLIRERRPPVLFGEQVASKAADSWADLVQDDLEALGYAFGAVPFPAASVGSPHIRDRLYWMAYHHQFSRRQGSAFLRGGDHGSDALTRPGPSRSGEPGHQGSNELGDAHVEGSQGRGLPASECARERSAWSASDFIWCRDDKWRPVEPGSFPLAHGAPARVGRLRGYGNAIVAQQAQVFIEASGLI